MDKKQQVLEEITKIFRNVLNQPELELEFGSSAKTVEKWDSINNLVLLSGIEEKYNINFDIDFILEAENVGDLCDYVLKHSAAV